MAVDGRRRRNAKTPAGNTAPNPFLWTCGTAPGVVPSTCGKAPARGASGTRGRASRRWRRGTRRPRKPRRRRASTSHRSIPPGGGEELTAAFPRVQALARARAVGRLAAHATHVQEHHGRGRARARSARRSHLGIRQRRRFRFRFRNALCLVFRRNVFPSRLLQRVGGGGGRARRRVRGRARLFFLPRRAHRGDALVARRLRRRAQTPHHLLHLVKVESRVLEVLVVHARVGAVHQERQRPPPFEPAHEPLEVVRALSRSRASFRMPARSDSRSSAERCTAPFSCVATTASGAPFSSRRTTASPAPRFRLSPPSRRESTRFLLEQARARVRERVAENAKRLGGASCSVATPRPSLPRARASDERGVFVFAELDVVPCDRVLDFVRAAEVAARAERVQRGREGAQFRPEPLRRRPERDVERLPGFRRGFHARQSGTLVSVLGRRDAPCS